MICFLEKYKSGGKSGAGGGSGASFLGGLMKRAQEPKSEELERRKYLEVVVRQLRAVVHADSAGSMQPPSFSLHRKWHKGLEFGHNYSISNILLIIK